MQSKALIGFSRYKFFLIDGEVAVMNKSTFAKVGRLNTMSEVAFSLTHDKGKRHTVRGETIKNLFQDDEKTELLPLKTSSKRKLTDEQVNQIRSRVLGVSSQKALAKEFRVHQSTISDIKRGTLHKK